MRRTPILLLGLVLFGCGEDYPVRSGPQAPSALRITPASRIVAVDQSFTADVEVADAQELFGIAFEIDYDDAVIEATGAAAGPALGSDVLVFEKREIGRISMAVSRKRGLPGFSGSGVIATLSFRALNPGRSNLSFAQRKVEAAGQDGLPVANVERFVVHSASVNVLGTASAEREDEVEVGELVGQTGQLRFNLQFTNEDDVDLDLHVVDPAGEEIYYDNESAGSGGTLDVDCYCDGCPRGPNENVYWPEGAAPAGEYGYWVEYFEACGAGTPSSQFTLRVIVGGQIVATQRGTLSSGASTRWTFRL